MALNTGSVVVPATSDTSDTRWPVRALISEDLPAFRLPNRPMCSRAERGVFGCSILIPPRTRRKRRVLSFSRVFLQQIHHTESGMRCQAQEGAVKSCIFFRNFPYFPGKELRTAGFFCYTGKRRWQKPGGRAGPDEKKQRCCAARKRG
jgi:hypothetical protein